MSRKKTILAALFATGISMCSASVFAAVTAEEAKQLGATLTEFGAEKAGNKEGTIPAYTGGIEKVVGFDPKTSKRYVDPFANERPLYSIDSQNLAQYEQFLPEGTKALIKRFAGYRVDVYPSHRSARYPSWVNQNTLKNATTTSLGGTVEGDDPKGADKEGLPFPGVFFPIPKTGYEVMWNHMNRFAPAVQHLVGGGWVVDAGGTVGNLPAVDEWYVHPWWDKANKLRPQLFDAVFGFNALLTAPPSSAGIVFLNFYTPKGSEGGQKVWFYTPGQRRVRMAPEFAYDVPIASYGGVLLWDEVFGMVGRMDRFNYKLVGKKEMIVPYNTYKMTNQAPVNTFFKPKFVNPDLPRFEKHRVWVVEATLKPTARHAYSRRTYYIDEDSWAVVSAEHYDQAGALYRVQQQLTYPTYDVGGIDATGWITYDLIKGNYVVINTGAGDPGNSMKSYDSSEGLQLNLTAQSVAGSSVR